MTPFIHRYFVNSIQGNARVFQWMLRDLDANDARWDSRPVAERFSLREVVAHLVDYDSVSRERFERMIREESPEFPLWNPDDAAAHYITRDPLHGVESLLLSRRELGDWLMGLSQKEWKRTATRPQVGEFSVEEGAAFMLAHDSYHLAQVADWLGMI